jgi:hypothetical protein
MATETAPAFSAKQLHGAECIRCDARDGLVPIGFVYTEGESGARYGWAVRACPDHAMKGTR